MNVVNVLFELVHEKNSVHLDTADVLMFQQLNYKQTENFLGQTGLLISRITCVSVQTLWFVHETSGGRRN